MRAGLPQVLVLAGLLYLSSLGARDLWNPNEPLYATVVAEMAGRGDWILPTANAEPFGEKPILYFWMALAASKVLGGVSETSLRLPAAVAGLALVLGTGLLVGPYAGRTRAALAATIVATFYLVFWSARQIQMDLTLAACSLAALLAAVRVLDFGYSRMAGAALAGVAVGCGLLAKGPVGAVCPALAVLGYVAVSRRWREFDAMTLAAVAAWALAVAAPWYVAVLVRGGPGLLGELLLRQNVERFLAPWDHAAGWWYYLVYFWVDLLPWSLFLPLAIGLVPRDEAERRLHRLAWVWLISTVVFFSLSASKRSPYILPAAPAVAVLVAAVAERWFRRELDPLRRRACVAVFGVLASAWIVAAVVVVREAGELEARLAGLATSARVAAVLLLVGGVAVWAALLFARRWAHAAPAAAVAALATVVLTYLCAAVAVLPAFDALKSHRPMAEAIARIVPRDRPLAGFHTWRWRADFSYYAKRAIPVIQDREGLLAFWSRDEQVFLVVERGLVEEARAVIGPQRALAYHEAGHNAAYLFSNRPSDQVE